MAFHQGRGTNKDVQQAKYWYNRAATRGHKTAAKWYDNLVAELGGEVGAELSVRAL
jgi:TPR repeat protein